MSDDSKRAALRIVEGMPDDASLEDIMHELYFRQRVDRGLAELEQGRTVAHDEVERGLAEWLRSDGR